MASDTYIGVSGSKKRVKEIYVGVTSSATTINITNSNISTYFTVTNGTYYFVGNGSTFTSNNKGKKGTTATTTLTAKQDISNLTFSYSYSSETNYDKFTLIVAGSTKENAVSGSTTTKTYSGSIQSGQKIEFKYVKDSSQDRYDDQCTFSNMKVTIGKSETNAPKKVKAGYIGVNGVPKLFYNSEYRWNQYELVGGEVTTDLPPMIHDEDWGSSYSTYAYADSGSFYADTTLLEYIPTGSQILIEANENNPMAFGYILYPNRPDVLCTITLTYTYGYGISIDTNPVSRIEPYSPGDLMGVVVSSDPYAYPDNGEQGGYWYTKI